MKLLCIPRYGEDGFNLIGFPCNQFGGQAPGTSEEERAWAHKKIGRTFDVFGACQLRGAGDVWETQLHALSLFCASERSLQAGRKRFPMCTFLPQTTWM